jgi:Mrp family chromosome partitioning ATPase
VTTASGAVLPIDAEPDEGAEVHRVVDVRDAVRSIGDAYDLVLVDAPALLASSNALDIAGQADGLVLLVPHRVPLRDLREARDRLAFVKTPLLGYVYVRPLGIRAHRRAGERKGER